MKPEIEDLIEIYENKEKCRQRIVDAAKRTPIPDLAEALDVQDKINFGKNRQRAEMLKQNEVFLKELSGIKDRLGERFFRLWEEKMPSLAPKTQEKYDKYTDNLILKSDFAEPRVVIFSEDVDSERDLFFDGPPLELVIVEGDRQDLESLSFKLRCKKKVFYRYVIKWGEFCTNWHVSKHWHGNLKLLHKHILPPVIVERDEKNHNLPVVIRLGAWATREDVEQAWKNVEKIMKEAHICRERESENFLRDKIWHQLNKKEAMSPLSIARFWAKKFPEEIDLDIIWKITWDEEGFANVPLKQRLEEVLSGDKQLGELKGRFLAERDFYIRVSFKDKVKKAIKKTEKRLKRLGSEELDRNRQKLLCKAHAPKSGEK
jgi:hypothetical protein